MHSTDTARGDPRNWSEATQLTTEILDDTPRVDSEGRDLGKQVSEHVRELFVVCDPAEALRQHFEVGVTPFLAVHDLGSGKSRDFLAALSKASGWPLRRLHIRRQGFGTTLATLHYLDCPGQHQHSLRLYASHAEAESTARIAIRRQLLASATANALLAEELPEQVATLAYACLRDDLLSRHRVGVSMLVMPQARSPRLMQDIEALQHMVGSRIETAPVTSMIGASWALLATYWNREAAHTNRPDMPVIAQINLGAGTVSAPAAAAPRQAAAPAVVQMSVADYLTLAAARTSAQSACIFNVGTRAVEAHTGNLPAADLAQQGQALLMSIARVGDGLALGRSISEASVALGDTQVVIRPVRLSPGCAMVLVLKRTSDPNAWRRELEHIDAALR